MRVIIICVLVVFVAGCESEPLYTSPELDDFRAKKREELFFKCLEAAKVSQNITHYSDNDEVVDSCANQSYFISRSYKYVPVAGE